MLVEEGRQRLSFDYVNSVDSVLFTTLITSTSVSKFSYTMLLRNTWKQIIPEILNQIVQAGSSSPSSSFFKSALLPPYTCLDDAKALLWLGLGAVDDSFFSARFLGSLALTCRPTRHIFFLFA